MDNDFAYTLLISNYTSNQLTIASTSTAQPKLNKENVRDLVVIVPPLAEQAEIIKIINEKAMGIDKTISVIEKEVNLLEEYRTALINEVVTGKRCIL